MFSVLDAEVEALVWRLRFALAVLLRLGFLCGMFRRVGKSEVMQKWGGWNERKGIVTQGGKRLAKNNGGEVYDVCDASLAIDVHDACSRRQCCNSLPTGTYVYTKAAQLFSNVQLVHKSAYDSIQKQYNQETCAVLGSSGASSGDQEEDKTI